MYSEYFGMVRHLVMENSGAEADAKDVFQEAMVALFEMVQKPGFSFTAQPSTLLYSIARNKWLKSLRGKGKEVSLRDFEVHEEVKEYDAEKDVLIDKMEQALKFLGQPCEGILRSFYYLKKSMAEIAAEHGYKSATHTKAQKYKCLQRLKRAARC